MRNMLARGYPVGIADGDGAVGKPLFEAAVGVRDRLALLGGGLPLFGFERDFHGPDADVDVDPPAALHAFLPRVQPTLAQKLRQPDVQGMLVFSRGHGAQTSSMAIGRDCSIRWRRGGRAALTPG